MCKLGYRLNIAVSGHLCIYLQGYLFSCTRVVEGSCTNSIADSYTFRLDTAASCPYMLCNSIDLRLIELAV